MNAWYTLYTKANAEYLVAALLQQQNLELYLPEVQTPAVSSAQKPQRKPFFPCYLFVNVDLSTVGPSSLQWIPGARRLVAFDEQPVPVPDSVIQLIRFNLEHVNASGGMPAHAFKSGEMVRVTGGPFEGMLAVFEGPSTPSERVHVLLTVLGRASRTQIAVTDLKKASLSNVPSQPLPKRPRRTRGKGRFINPAAA